jgi:hypothetical protein
MSQHPELKKEDYEEKKYTINIIRLILQQVFLGLPDHEK